MWMKIVTDGTGVKMGFHVNIGRVQHVNGMYFRKISDGSVWKQSRINVCAAIDFYPYTVLDLANYISFH